jgi:anti-anti-sigma factor
MMMLKITVLELGDASVLRCKGQIVVGDVSSILRSAILSQQYTRMLVLDLAGVDRIDAGGLGVLLDVREWARSGASVFKLMNVTKNVEEILELTHLQNVFEFCSVRDSFFACCTGQLLCHRGQPINLMGGMNTTAATVP